MVATVVAGTSVHPIRQANESERSLVPVTLPASCGWSLGSVSGPPTLEETIDLGVALRLAGVDNPTINLAQEQIQEALAGQLAARSLLLPSLNFGGNFRLHRGVLQDDPGNLLNPNSQSLYLGAGAGAVATGTQTIPGIWLFAHLGDAVYEPLAARQRVRTRTFDAQVVENAVLLDVATAYLELAGAEARLDLLRRAESDVKEIVRITTAFAQTGQGTPADMNRSAANAELIRSQIPEAEGEIAAASARLAQLLTLDPSIRLHTAGTVEPLRLVDEDSDLESLIDMATLARPDLVARSAALQEAETRMRQERARPWFPLVAVGYSGGFMGGGSNQAATEFSSLQERSDLAVMAVWNVQNLGVGNHARLHEAQAAVGQATAAYEITVNQIRREVAEAQAACKTAARQIEVAKRSLVTAEEGFQLEKERIRKVPGRPIETLDSFRQLLDAQQELLRATVAFDIAQMQLFVALGIDRSSELYRKCVDDRVIAPAARYLPFDSTP